MLPRPGLISRRWPRCSRQWTSPASPCRTPHGCCRCRVWSALIRLTAWRSPHKMAAMAPTSPRARKAARSPSEEQLFDITVEQALALLATPRQYGRRGAPKPPLREFGNDPVSSKPVVAKEGKFGVYVTDGETNASLTRSDRLEEMTPERAYELLAIRRENAGNGIGRKKRAPCQKSRPRSLSKKKAQPSGIKTGLLRTKALTKYNPDRRNATFDERFHTHVLPCSSFSLPFPRLFPCKIALLR